MSTKSLSCNAASPVPYEGIGSDVRALSFTPDSDKILAASSDGYSRVWQRPSRVCTYVLARHADDTLCIAANVLSWRGMKVFMTV